MLTKKAVRHFAILCAIGAAIAVSGWAYSQGFDVRDAPSSKQDPVAIDRAWQQAVKKYDGSRADILENVDRVIDAGPFRPDWESLQTYRVPEWYRDAKFGIFIHWGVYSVPAFGDEWYGHYMYQEGRKEFSHHKAVYGSQSTFGYKDFIPMFKAEHFDPKGWAQLFKKAGAKYVVPVAEHHDGFAMYDSALSDWTSVKMGPHRDIVGDLAKAVRSEGLHFGTSSHRAEHDFFFATGRTILSDVNDPRFAGLYGPAHNWLENKGTTPMSNDFTYVSPRFADDWLARAAEIVEKYHPEIMYFDWWDGQPLFRHNLARFAAFYYNTSLKDGDHIGVINYKDYAMREGSAVLDLERQQLSSIRPLPWQTDTSISNKSWGYINDDTYKSAEFVVHELIDIVSKNGNLLLNIGPRSDGTIPSRVQHTLLDVGSWLNVNGEGIYGSRPWKTYGEGPSKAGGTQFHDTAIEEYTAADFRFTTKGDALYAIELAWPPKGEPVIYSLGSKSGLRIKSVALLGSNERLQFQQEHDALRIHVRRPVDREYAYTFKILFQKAHAGGKA